MRTIKPTNKRRRAMNIQKLLISLSFARKATPAYKLALNLERAEQTELKLVANLYPMELKLALKY